VKGKSIIVADRETGAVKWHNAAEIIPVQIPKTLCEEDCI